MMQSLVVRVFLAFFTARFAVESLLLLLNLRHSSAAGASVPVPLRDRISPETAERSRGYALAKGRFALAALAWDSAVTLSLLFSGCLPWLDGALANAGLEGATRFVAFLLALSAGTGLATIPVSLYGTFALEARFGFNRTTWRTWVSDELKSIAVGLLLGVPLLYAAWFFMSATGTWWWLWLWAFLGAIQILLLWLYPALIAPLFNKFAPLGAGDLRSRLEELCRATGFRAGGLFVMDASRRSAHSNAYFTGFVRPRIVLFDTLVSSMSVDEATAVLAHEIGHFRLRHVLKRLASGLVLSLAGLWLLSLIVRWPAMFHAFGFQAASWQAAVAILSLAGGAFTFFLTPISAWISRRHEYAADRYSVERTGLPEALQSALVKLNRENLANLHPHPWYSRWHHSHPTLLERLEALDALRGSMRRGLADP
jgi:STE24 endopeptidase